MKVRIEIDTKTFVRFWLVVIGFAVAILAIYSARTALIIIGTALFLALALNEPVTRLARHLPGKSRLAGTAIAYVVVVLVLGVFAFLVVPPIVQQTMKFVDSVPGIVDTARTQSQGLNNFIEHYHLQPQVDKTVESIKNSATGWAADIGKNVAAGVGSVLGIITSLLLVLVLSFLMLVEGPSWVRRIWGVYRDESRMEHHRDLARRMYAVVTGYVTGQLIVSAIGAAASGLTVFVLSMFFNVPANLALPTVAIAFTLSLIPMFGATIAGVLVAALLAFNDITAALIFIVFFFLYQQIENNFVSPTIQSRRLELSALTVLVSVTIGLYVFGLAGGIISIPIAGCIRVLVDDYLLRAKRQRSESMSPLSKIVKQLKNEA
jgi:predicted PurR-regulated permease PerM